MRVLITGGFGFIGSRLGQLLIQNGYEVLLGSRKLHNTPDWLPQAEVVQTDWNNKESLSKICRGVDVVVHASGMNAQESVDDPEKALVVNGRFIEILIESAILKGVKKIIYLSTAHVYAAPLVGTINEHSPTTNSHPYATSHLAGERAVLEASNNGKIDGVVARLSNTFGTPAHIQVNCWMLLVNELCRQVITKKKLLLKSSGIQMRDFVSMIDVCRAIEYLIVTDVDTKEENIVNIGSGKSCTVYEMALQIQACCNDLWGFTPAIDRQQITEKKKFAALNYQMNYLNQKNYEFIDNFEKELKQLLHFCEIYFSDKVSISK